MKPAPPVMSTRNAEVSLPPGSRRAGDYNPRPRIEPPVKTVSVIIPTYNRAHFVGLSIDSALQQTHPPLEVIVVDDGSTDDTAAALASYADRIRVFRQPNSGAPSARNLGAANASGDYLAFLDSDDLWYPEKLERQLQRFDAEPELGLVHCGMESFDDATGRVLEVNVDGAEGWVAEQMLHFDKIVVFAGSSLLIPRRVFQEVGGFDVRLPPSEDWDLCYRIASRYKVGFVAGPYVRYRQHPGAIHLDIPKMERAMMLSFDKIFSSPDAKVQRLRRFSYGRIHRILAGCYFVQHDLKSFLRNAVRSLVYDPRNISYFAAYPVRAVSRALRGGA
jgi:glycosyltransferase involved in cell wall biosynthesis